MSNNTETPKVKKEASTNIRGKSNSQPPHNHDINCFHCLGISHITFMCSNEKTMIFHDHRKVKKKKSDSDDEKMSPFEVVNNNEVENLLIGKSLMVRRALSVQVKKDGLKQHIYNIFCMTI